MPLDLDGFLAILMVVDEGEHSIHQVAEATGLSERDAHRVLESLESTGFLKTPAGNRHDAAGAAGYVVSTTGKTLLRLAFDEIYKRELAEQLGSPGDHAS